MLILMLLLPIMVPEPINLRECNQLHENGPVIVLLYDNTFLNPIIYREDNNDTVMYKSKA